jgi:hypothetical protein
LQRELPRIPLVSATGAKAGILNKPLIAALEALRHPTAKAKPISNE